MEYEKTYSAIVADCAEQGKSLSRKICNDGISEALYLYVKPATETENGRLFLARDSAPNPYGYKLVTGEGLRANVPYEQYYSWIADRAKREPLFAYGE